MKIVIWKRKDNSFYYRLVKGHYGDYPIGYHNQYGHEVMFTIDRVYISDYSFKRRKRRRFRFFY